MSDHASRDVVAQRVATLVTDLRDRFEVFGNLAQLLASTERHVAAAEDARHAAEREQREAERREACAMATCGELEDLRERLNGSTAAEAKRFYRRGYETGYCAGKRGARRNENPKPRLRAIAGLGRDTAAQAAG